MHVKKDVVASIYSLFVYEGIILHNTKISIVVTLSIQRFLQAMLTNKIKNFLIRIKLELIIASIVAEYKKQTAPK